MVDLTGKVVVITGAARGLGQTYATVFANAGASVAVADLNPCDETQAAVTSAGSPCIQVQCDVSDSDQTQRLADSVHEAFGRVDVLINNAAMWGGLTFGPFDRIPEAEWDQTMAVNIRGIWNMCKAFVPHLRNQGGGSIINIASLAAKYGMPFGLHYTTSKAAVIGLTRGLARELGRDRIRVNAVAPNVVANEAAGEFFGDRLDKLISVTQSQQALPGELKPDDVAGTLLYLASDQSRPVTGQTLMVDGGTVLL